MDSLLDKGFSFLKRNSSTMLTCIGAIGVITTTIAAISATTKAVRLLDAEKAEKGGTLTKAETVRLVGPLYIPTIFSGAATMICIFGANTLSRRSQMSLISAYSMLENRYSEYRNRMLSKYGEEARMDICKETAAAYRIEEKTGTPGKQLFFDYFSLQYFESTMDEVLEAERMLQEKYDRYGAVCLNDFYDFLMLPRSDGGGDLGWSKFRGDKIEFLHEDMTFVDGQECCVISFPYEPSLGYIV